MPDGFFEHSSSVSVVAFAIWLSPTPDADELTAIPWANDGMGPCQLLALSWFHLMPIASVAFVKTQLLFKSSDSCTKVRSCASAINKVSIVVRIRAGFSSEVRQSVQGRIPCHDRPVWNLALRSVGDSQHWPRSLSDRAVLSQNTHLQACAGKHLKSPT